MDSQIPPSPSHIVAFMDLGTNSVRLSLVRLNPDHSYSMLAQRREAVRLGDGAYATHDLRPDAMDRAVRVCRTFAELARTCGVTEIIAVATSATRDARNQAEFLHRLRQEAGVEVRVISGDEEARVIYRGVSSGMDLGGQTALFIDIGGGSTEIIVGDRQQPFFLDSLKLGAIRLSNQYLLEKELPVSDDCYGRMQANVRDAAARTLRHLRAYPIAFAVGSSGTIKNLAQATTRRIFDRPWRTGDAITYAQLRETIDYLRALPLEERRRVPGLNPERADIVIGGAAVVDTLLAELGITTLRVSGRGLREGLLVEYLSRLA